MQESYHIDRERSRNTRITLGFGGLVVNAGDHIGHFYRTTDEWQKLFVSFFKCGLQAGDKCVYLMSPETRQQDVRAALSDAQIDVKSALESGQLVLQGEKVTPQAIRAWRARLAGELYGQFRFLRWAGDMTWTLKQIPDHEMLTGWESICHVSPGMPAVFLCQYDLTKFVGNVVIKALQAHALCIIGNVIHRNPCFGDLADCGRHWRLERTARDF